MISGRETTIPALGHVNLLMIDDLIPAIRGTSPPSVPLASIYDQAWPPRAPCSTTMRLRQKFTPMPCWGKAIWWELLQFGLYGPKSDWTATTCCSTAATATRSASSDYPVCRTMSDSLRLRRRRRAA